MAIQNAWRRTAGAVAIAWLLLNAGAVRAEADESDDKGTIIITGIRAADLETVSPTGSRLNLTPLETPATLSVIDGDTIRARGDMSIVEAEARAPGITNVGNLGNGNTALAARGFAGQGSVLQLIDGVRLFPAAGTVTFPTDPWMVERIDILSGPASVLYGQGAMGAAVNVIMRKPNSSRTEVEAEAGFGSQNSAHVAAGIGGPLSDQFSYRVDASYRRSDGYVDRGDSHYFSASSTLRWAPNEALAVTLRNDFGNANPQKYTGTPLVNGKLDTRIRERNYNISDAVEWSNDNRTTLEIDWHVSDNLTFNNQVYRLSSKRKWTNLESYCVIASTGDCPNGYNLTSGTPGTVYRTDNFGIIHDQVQWGDQASLTLRTPLSDGISNDLVVGADLNSIRFKYSHDFNGDVQEDFVDLLNPVPGKYLLTVGITPQFRTKTDEYAFFAEDRLKLSEQFSIVGGIRVEHDRVKRWSIATGSDVFVLDKSFNNTTWRVGAVYQPTKKLSFYAQYATGVDPLGTLVTLGNGQVSANGVQLSHATGNQIEVGAKMSFLDGHGAATVSAYRLVKNGLLAQKTLSSPIEQVGQRSAQGIEASLSLDLAGGFGIDANGTILDANFDDFISGGTSYSGKTPPNIAEELANLWLRWDATSRLQARAGLRYVGPTYSDNANKFRVPGYVTVDGTISYAITPQLAVDVHGYNLFNKDYAQTTYNDEQWILGRPRSVDVSLRASF
ncbi:MAG TPA: TonB-dependent receptor [Sphingobium sp.]